MNWLDWTLIVLLAMAAFKGFQRGFIIELASLVALVLGIWAGIHLSERVTEALGLEVKSAALAFLITFVLVLVGVHLLARFLTKLIDLAQLGVPNKLAGIFFGVVRSAFTLSIALNLLLAYSSGALPPEEARQASTLHHPISSFAPLLVPALEDSKWVQRTIDAVKEEWPDAPGP